MYWAPMYQNRVAFGKSGFPFVSEYTERDISYERGICPVAEETYERNLIFGKFCHWPLTIKHMDQVVEAMDKVLAHRDVLLSVEQRG